MWVMGAYFKLGGVSMKVKDNFQSVLEEYRENDKITYQADVVLEIMSEGIAESYEDILEEEYVDKIVDLKESFESEVISDIGVVEEEKGKGMTLKINETEYRYVSDKYSPVELAAKFETMRNISGKDAFLWLKENAVNYWHDRPYDTNDVKRSLDERVEEWNQNTDDIIKVKGLEESEGFLAVVFESENGEIHKTNDTVKEIEEYLSNKNVDFEWVFERDEKGIDVWYLSYIAEKTLDDLEGTEEFEKKINDKMSEVESFLDGKDEFNSAEYVDFEVEGDNVDVEFVVDLSDEDIDEDSLEEYMESIDFIDEIIDKVGQAVDDYDDLFLQFANLDMEIDGSKVEIEVEFKVVDDLDEGLNEAVASRPTESISPSDLIVTVDADKLFQRRGGKELFEFLKNKDFLRKDMDDYIKVEVYKASEDGVADLIFITEVFGYEAEELVRVQTSIMDDDVRRLFKIKQR